MPIFLTRLAGCRRFHAHDFKADVAEKVGRFLYHPDPIVHFKHHPMQALGWKRGFAWWSSVRILEWQVPILKRIVFFDYIAEPAGIILTLVLLILVWRLSISLWSVTVKMSTC